MAGRLVEESGEASIQCEVPDYMIQVDHVGHFRGEGEFIMWQNGAHLG